MSIQMPQGKQNAVCITFDFDAVSLWFSYFKTFGSQGIGRGEYGARVGADRLLQLLERYEVPTTWFVPGHTAESWPAITKAIAAGGHEIAHHGYCHENPPEIEEREEETLVRGIEALETVVGRRPVGYRAPSWETTTNTVTLLLKHGFIYAGNGMAQDFQPYRARIGDRVSLTEPFRLGHETDLIEIPSGWHLTDSPLLEVGPPFNAAGSLTETERIWKDEFDYMHERVPNGVITYAFHPQCIARGHRIMILERLLEHMRQSSDVWFARMDQIAQSWTPEPAAG